MIGASGAFDLAIPLPALRATFPPGEGVGAAAPVHYNTKEKEPWNPTKENLYSFWKAQAF